MIMNRLFPKQFSLKRTFNFEVALTLLSLVVISATEFGLPSIAFGAQSASRGSGSTTRTVPAPRGLSGLKRAPILPGSDRDPTSKGSPLNATSNLIEGSSTRAPTIGQSSNQGSATANSPDQDSENKGDTAQRQPTYFDILLAIRNNESEINRLFSSIPIGFPSKQKMHMDKIEEIKAKNIQLKSMLDMAAVQAYQNDPQNNARAGQIIYRQMLSKLEPKNYELHFDPRGALAIADVLLKSELGNGEVPGEIRFQDVAYQAFLASYAILDFGRAELMLKKIGEQGIRLRPQILTSLAATRERWQRELRIRRLEGITDDLPKVKFETTEGTFLVELFENHAPDTVGNFIDLVEKKFYNDMTFFLVRPGEYVQTGCPNGNGTGDAGYQIPCECYREQIRHNFTGVLCMANNGQRDTGGSQFFISHRPSEQFDGKFTTFGRVKEGMEVIYKLQTVDKTVADPAEIEPSKIIRATVVWKRDRKYEGKRIRTTDPAALQSTAFEAQSGTPAGDLLEKLEQQASTTP